MKEIPKNMIGLSGKYFVQSMLIREGLPTASGKNGIDLVVRLKKPRREFYLFVVSNLQPKRAGGKGKEALDWWVPVKTDADVVACVDLSALRVYLFNRDELARFAQQRTAAKHHLYMYTDKAVALRGKKNMKFDYEFEAYKLENRVHRGIFDRRIMHVVSKKETPRPRARAAKAVRAGRSRPRAGRGKRGGAARKG